MQVLIKEKFFAATKKVVAAAFKVGRSITVHIPVASF